MGSSCKNIGSYYSYKWLDTPIKGILLSVNGVLTYDDKAVDGALLGFELLKNSKRPYRILSNESKESKTNLTKSLRYIGYKVAEKNVITPIPVLVKTLKKYYYRPYLLVHKQVLGEFKGFEEFKGFDCDVKNCVVIGDAGPNYNYHNLNTAFQLLLNMPEPRLFALGVSKYSSSKDGPYLDVGTFTKALEYSSGARATIIGKPSPEYFHQACHDMGLEPKDVIMIGFDMESDIRGAQASGIRAIVVRSDKFRNLDKAALTADGVVRNLYEAMMFINSVPKKKT